MEFTEITTRKEEAKDDETAAIVGTNKIENFRWSEES